MKKRYWLSLILSLVSALMIGGCGNLSYRELVAALRSEGLTVAFTDNMAPDHGEFLINNDIRLLFVAEKNQTQAEAHSKRIRGVADTYVVKNLLITVYPSPSDDEASEKKLENAISKFQQ